MSSPPPWFPVDAELWQEPGPHKLPWYARRVAVYLRSRADREDELVLTSTQRIVADTKLSGKKVRLSLEQLKTWPSRRQRFIRSYQPKYNRITLRPLPIPFVRCYRWLWESPLPDDLKDIILFVRSRFAGKTNDGQELFDCNRQGRRQPSILRCCYLRGTDFRGRERRLLNMVRWLEQSGMMAVEKRSTMNRAMVVRLCDETPSPTVSKILSRLRSGEQKPDQVGSKASSSGEQNISEVGPNASSSGDTPKSVSKSVFQSPPSESFSNPAPAGQEERGISLTPAKRLTEYLTRKNELVQLLKACVDSKNLVRGKLSFDQSAENFLKIWKSFNPVDQDELLVEDLLWALTSEVWNGMDRVLGLRLSHRYQDRFKEELLVSLEIRREEERKRQQEELRREQERVRRTPKYQFEKALERPYPGIRFGICFEMDDALPHIIWYTCPHLREEFKPLLNSEDVFRCLEPSTFLSQADIEQIFPVWKRVFESEFVFDAIEALRSSSDLDEHHQTPGSGRVAPDEDAELDRRLAEICGR